MSSGQKAWADDREEEYLQSKWSNLKNKAKVLNDTGEIPQLLNVLNLQTSELKDIIPKCTLTVHQRNSIQTCLDALGKYCNE